MWFPTGASHLAQERGDFETARRILLGLLRRLESEEPIRHLKTLADTLDDLLIHKPPKEKRHKAAIKEAAAVVRESFEQAAEALGDSTQPLRASIAGSLEHASEAARACLSTLSSSAEQRAEDARSELLQWLEEVKKWDRRRKSRASASGQPPAEAAPEPLSLVQMTIFVRAVKAELCEWVRKGLGGGGSGSSGRAGRPPALEAGAPAPADGLLGAAAADSLARAATQMQIVFPKGCPQSVEPRVVLLLVRVDWMGWLPTWRRPAAASADRAGEASAPPQDGSSHAARMLLRELRTLVEATKATPLAAGPVLYPRLLQLYLHFVREHSRPPALPPARPRLARRGF